MLVARAELDSRLDALDAEQRRAGEDVVRCAAQLSDLERQAASGTKVSEKTRAEAEQALAKARARHAEPWAERRAGVQDAARDADRAVTQYVAEHLDALLDELHEDADAAAEAVNRACHALVSAFYERQRVEQQVITLARVIRVPRPTDVPRTRAEGLVAQANALLEAGGEAAPRLTVDPRKPRHSEIAEPVEQPVA